MSDYYVTTSIPYVNGEPHLGHAMEIIMGDVLARRARQQGDKVIFSIGTDEHGGKIAEKAAEMKLTPKALEEKTVGSGYPRLCARLQKANLDQKRHGAAPASVNSFLKTKKNNHVSFPIRRKGRRRAGPHHVALLQDHVAIGQADERAHVLVDDQDGLPLAFEPCEALPYLGADQRGRVLLSPRRG